MPTYNVPGVWVEEIASFPPSVAQVATAIPAFLGYTEKGGEVTRIETLLDYEKQFGKAKPASFQATRASDGTVTLERRDAATNNFLLYYALSMYFRNGGGACYVVPVGDYTDTPAKEDFETGLGKLEMYDEPTLIVLVDAIGLGQASYYGLVQAALAQCSKLGDRFLIADVPLKDKNSLRDDVAAFRKGIGSDHLSYGAAYHPFLLSGLNYQYDESGVSLPGVVQWSSGSNGLAVSATGAGRAYVKLVAREQAVVDPAADPAAAEAAAAAAAAIDFHTDGDGNTLAVTLPADGKTTAAQVLEAWKAWTGEKRGFALVIDGDGSAALPPGSYELTGRETLASVKTSNTALYNKVKAALADIRVVLPPSSAVAGIYARVDRERGVWKAPANVGVSAAIGPVSKISNDDQASLNVDADSGISINVIRDFTGKGTLVWGARTLLGNDNEWRYVPVRRLFITIEESTRKASSFAVFEPNDATTWLKVKAMIDSYLYGLWEQGALAGARPDQAYFVNIGLGKTMTAQDILEGRMIVEIGVAAVRPAEFIILRFSHKLQEA